MSVQLHPYVDIYTLMSLQLYLYSDIYTTDWGNVSLCAAAAAAHLLRCLHTANAHERGPLCLFLLI